MFAGDVGRMVMRQHLFRPVLVSAVVLALTAGGSAAASSAHSSRQGDRLPARLATSFVRAGAHAVTRPAPARGRGLCVGVGNGCFGTIQGALDAAADGDTISIGPGVFSGGLTV